MIEFSHVTDWVFDLDNTLYPPHVRLFDQIEQRMTQYVMDTLAVSQEKADYLRQYYWREHGTTLAGLMREHNLDPEPYLKHVHDISFEALTPDAILRGHIENLPGRKIIYTNGCAPYAEQVIAKRGLSGAFDAIYGVEHAGYHPKPERAAFDTVFDLDGLTPQKAAMFEDDARNLLAPHEMGMCTILVRAERQEGAYIQFHTDNLNAFLAGLL